MHKLSLSLLGIAAIGLCVGCSGPVTTYGNAQAQETVNAEFGSTDLQLIADKMVNSLVASNRTESLDRSRACSNRKARNILASSRRTAVVPCSFSK